MALTDAHARSSLRFSFGRFNSDTEVDRTIDVLEQAVKKLRPLVAT
jgi:cysteine sulfinate desulfinase/cysteine desulfurase-like protein